MKKVVVSMLAIMMLTMGISVAAPVQNRFYLNFDDASDADDWTTDRTEPEVWETTMFDGDNRLHININDSKTTGDFYHYQGRKFLDKDDYWNAEMTTVLKYKFYIDPSWETDEKPQATGMWAVTGNESAITAYSVLEYRDSDAAGEAQFRLFKQDGKWYDVGLPGSVKQEKGGWVDVKAVLVRNNAGPNGEAELWWFVDNARVVVDDSVSMGRDTDRILEIIINSDNFGYDQDYYYDDISLETRESKSRGNGPKR